MRSASQGRSFLCRACVRGGHGPPVTLSSRRWPFDRFDSLTEKPLEPSGFFTPPRRGFLLRKPGCYRQLGTVHSCFTQEDWYFELYSPTAPSAVGDY